MADPYRAPPPAEPEEPIPDLGVRRDLGWWDVLIALPVLLAMFLPGLPLWLLAPTLALCVALVLLERPFRIWRERRRVAALEAKAADEEEPRRIGSRV